MGNLSSMKKARARPFLHKKQLWLGFLLLIISSLLISLFLKKKSNTHENIHTW